MCRYTDDKIQTILVGTRCHKKDQRTVTEDRIKQFAEHIDAPYIEVSAEKNVNVDRCFELLVDTIFEKQPDLVQEVVLPDNNEEEKMPFSLCGPCCSTS